MAVVLNMYGGFKIASGGKGRRMTSTRGSGSDRAYSDTGFLMQGDYTSMNIFRCKVISSNPCLAKIIKHKKGATMNLKMTIQLIIIAILVILVTIGIWWIT